MGNRFACNRDYRICGNRDESTLVQLGIAIAALVFSFGILDIQTPRGEERYIKNSNQLRRKTYSLIEQKRKEKVSNKQISEAIKANLKVVVS